VWLHHVREGRSLVEVTTREGEPAQAKRYLLTLICTEASAPELYGHFTLLKLASTHLCLQRSDPYSSNYTFPPSPLQLQTTKSIHHSCSTRFAIQSDVIRGTRKRVPNTTGNAENAVP
jgi:hypothetical protein